MSQFFCTSLWFAGNAVIDDLVRHFDTDFNILGYLLSFVQFGFIIGTLTFALLTLADRFSPSRIFMICAFLGALCNLSLLIPNITIFNLLTARFGTGFFLAGIYPVGMKIASDYYKDGLGKALGFLVGALVLGTAFPHFINQFYQNQDFKAVIIATSILALVGGISIQVFVPDGPYRKAVPKLQLGVITQLFDILSFRKASFGYFGHMWELYTFWMFIPIMLKTYNSIHHVKIPISLWSFIIIGTGAISCIFGGLISLKIGSKKVAYQSLLISGIFCLASPFLFFLSKDIFLGALCIWAMFVISDSPQFSTMVAVAAPPELRGTGLTITNCIGFAITIASIQLLSFLADHTDNSIWLYPILGLGPAFGLYALRK
ncbi:MFS transporter [Aquimarina algicola]|uniref:MFS transporter n=1 Tax=Aquimarina algicola TaxID=2589995 RepID=UPI0029394C9B|nr:MFS transporter [Aquimarina algicola]